MNLMYALIRKMIKNGSYSLKTMIETGDAIKKPVVIIPHEDTASHPIYWRHHWEDEGCHAYSPII